MSSFILPFEKPINELEQKLNELKSFSEGQEINVAKEIERMEQKIAETRKKVYGNLTAWKRVQVARHPQRPYFRDYVKLMVTEYSELHGDRIHRDDGAVVGGFGTIGDHSVMLIGTQKGHDTKSNLMCNFGSPYPEGYRKALRLMRLANKFELPIVSLIDTPGAFPGIESEERHVAEAIAVNLRESFTFHVPMIAIVTGEGGSGGALGIGVANRIFVLDNAYYSVITPEGCAAILWKDRAFSDKAAEALKLTAQDLYEAGLTDGVIAEPFGGAHNNPKEMAEILKHTICEQLTALKQMSGEEIREERYQKFRAMGKFEEDLSATTSSQGSNPETKPAQDAGESDNQEESKKVESDAS